MQSIIRPGTDEIERRLRERFADARITVDDDSHLHAGHAGAAGGAGHYSVRVESARFAGLTTVARHRLVYDCLKDWMPARIHALAIVARAPGESA